MIKNSTEYKISLDRLDGQNQRIADIQKKLASDGLTPEEIKRATDPLKTFTLQIQEEVEAYKKREGL
ncbi:hypothetical protein [Micavibrio aeruginosavorus]|uniref:hypothetical protein n=1 Tax=Micavibrio aeruginosavorus TaxID=349221 RepID=UPI003F4AF304